MSLLVTGTDTGVGKTVVSAVVLARYSAIPVTYWKPVATGANQQTDTAQVARWTGAPVVPERYQFRPPVSPHLASRLARRPILANALVRAFSAHDRATSGRMLLEGIGGALVPFNAGGYLFADFARDLVLPAIVVARTTLGTINHTLLTLEALRRRKVPVAGVILNGPANRENRRAIERFGRVAVISELRPMGRVSRMAIRRVARTFDVRGELECYFG